MNNTKEYHITGLIYNTKRRFSMITHDYQYAMGINLWRGSVWEIVKGKRKLIKRVRC